LIEESSSAGAGKPQDTPLTARVFAPPPESHPLPPAFTAIALVAIVALASWLRIAQLGDLPAGFYCDEAGLGYNAYSILETGRDETGTHWPLYIWSFDTSYKNPVFVYAATLPLAWFGPTAFAVRLTAALFGIATVLAVFFLGRALMGARVGLLSALFLAVCPWHLHFSRIAFELISFPLFFVLGFTCLVSFLRGGRRLVVAALLFAVSLYTYVPAKLIVPLFLAGAALIYRRVFTRRWRETAAAIALFALAAAPLIAFDVANNERAGQYVRDTSLLYRAEPISQRAARFAANYSTFFSEAFLFTDGDPILRHAVRRHGELYTFLAPLLLLGLLTVAGRRDAPLLLVLWWLVVYPVPAALLNETPSASRGILGAPAFCVLAALGGGTLLGWVRRIAGRRRGAALLEVSVVALGASVLLPQVSNYWSAYSRDYRRYAAKFYYGFQYGNREAVEYFRAHYDEYDEFVLSTHLNNQPEVFLRFFAGLHEPPSDGVPPFEMPAKMTRAAPEELDAYKPIRQLFALVPTDLEYLERFHVRDRVLAPDGMPVYFLVDDIEPKDFAYTWMVLGPYPREETPPLPEYDPAAPPRRGPGGAFWVLHDAATAPVRLNGLYGADPIDVCAWAINFVYSREERAVQVFADFDDGGDIWINDEQVLLDPNENPYGGYVDSLRGEATLREGRNLVAVRTCNIERAWQFYFRLADPEGGRVEGIDWEYVRE